MSDFNRLLHQKTGHTNLKYILRCRQ